MKCNYCKQEKEVFPVAVKSCQGDPAFTGKPEKICRDCYEEISDTDPFYHGTKVVDWTKFKI